MTRTKRKLSSSSWIIPSLAIIILYLSNTVVSEAQFFDAFTANKRFFTGSKGGSGGLLGGLGGLGGGGGGGSGYGAPQKPSYGAPAQRPSYGTPQPKPSYGAQKPSYGGGGGGLNFKQIELPVPDINLPDPIEFKAGVLRSKGRIASGLLHAKAGILRAGANILAQKANALDKVAQAIPAVKAGLINTLKGFGGDKGGGGSGYGAPQSGYGTPQQQSRPQYNQPQSYNAPSTGYGNPQGPVLGQQNYNTQSVNVIPVNNLQNNLNNFNNQQQQQQQQNYNNQQQQQQNFNNVNRPSNNVNRPSNNLFFGNNNNGNSAPDSYGSPVANPIGPTNNQNQLLFNNAQQVSAGYSVNNNNGVSNTNQAQQVNQAYASLTGGNSNSNQFSPIINNNALQNNSPLNNRGNNNLVNNALQVNTNVDSNTVTNQQLNALNSFINNNDISNQANPFLTNSEKLILQESRQQQSGNLNQLQRQGQCRSDSSLNNLLEDLFMGHEIIPDILDRPPQYPLELTYKTVRTFPGMQLTADMTRFKPMLHWPAKNNALYTVVMSNLDINNRRNRTLSEFWHWFVANIPGQSVDDGDTLFEHLFPLVLPEGDGDHRFGYFVFEQPGVLDYSDEGGPTDSCSPNMSNGRGPFKSTKNFQKKYGLTLTAATFLIIDYNEASMQIACEWQKCIGDTINLVSPLKCGNEEK